MKIKIAALCPTTEKERADGKLIHKYAYPDADLAEAVRLANAFTDRGVEMLHQAANDGAKIACLPEGLPNLGRWRIKAPVKIKQEAWKRTWDHFCKQMSQAAKATGLCVIAGAIEPSGGKFYNAACLFNERGNFVGSYRKVHLAGGKKGEGKHLTPGNSFPVFPTRYGKVGMFICWDIMFPETTQALMLNGAQILFHPTYGNDGPQADLQAQTRAHDTVCPLVISMWCGNGRIIDRDGMILSRCGMFRDWRGIIPDQIVYGEVDPTAKRAFVVYPDFQALIKRDRQAGAYRVLVSKA